MNEKEKQRKKGGTLVITMRNKKEILIQGSMWKDDEGWKGTRAGAWYRGRGRLTLTKINGSPARQWG